MLWLWPAAWAGLLLWLGHRPGDAFPDAEPWSLPGVDKALHAVLYGVLGFLAGRAAPRRPLVAALFSAFVVGALDEWGQTAVPGRHASGFDLAADLAGAAAGGLLALRTFRPAARSR